jgi:peptidoglycan LD-endopeptidase LytH
MLRAILFLVLLIVVGGMGFYVGRSTAPMPMPEVAAVQPPVETPSALAQPNAAPDTAARARVAEPPPSPPPSPPNVLGTTPESGPPAPAGENTSPAAPPLGDASAFVNRKLTLPIKGLKRTDVQDTFDQARAAGERRHEATDIMSPRGTPVVAVDNGIVVKLFNSKQGGLTIYQFDSAERYCYYYAHLDSYARGLRDGMLVKRGDTIGYVGSTGNANPAAPHLHFAIFELGPDKRWWEGKPINPYPILMRSFE